MKAICRIRKEPYYRRAAFESGLKKVGFTLVDSVKPTGADDWLVIWNRQQATETEADEWERRGGMVIVVENGYLQKVDKTHYAISVHGHNGSGWFPVGDEDRFTKLGFHLKPWKKIDETGVEKILVIGQRGIGSRTMKSPPQWDEKMAVTLKRFHLPVYFRPHPGNAPPKIPLEHDLRRAQACVIWSSAAGVQALVEGVPVSYDAPHWVCAEAAQSNVLAVAKRDDDARAKALHRMSHAQWHHEEIATGEPFARIIERRGEAVW